MPSKHERLKSEIMAQIEEQVEQVLTQGENPLTLTQIEDLVLAARHQMEAELTQSLLEQQTHHTRSDLPSCPQCGQTLQPKGKKRRVLRTRSGEVSLHRPYFYCVGCRRGVFPPG